MLPVRCCDGVRYTVPLSVRTQALDPDGKITVRFRVDGVYRQKKIAVYAGDTLIFNRFRKILSPGEMETIQLRCRDILRAPDAAEITVKLEG